VHTNQIIHVIDAEIARLQQAKALLLGGNSVAHKSRVGRPPASPAPAAHAPKASKRKKRRLSAEGRKRIADAMKKRWAERRKQQASK
jgi:hypothetical protein